MLNFQKNSEIGLGSNKSFGIVFAIVFLIVALYPLLNSEGLRIWALSVPLSINQTWSIDFMSDSLNTGRKIRTFNVIDDYNRECLGIEVDHSLPAQRVIQSLERLIEWRGKPKAIRCDNGPEYISHALREWAQAMGIELMYIQPGKPTQNAYIERFNRTARNEWLNMHIFDSIEHAQSLATQWMWVYNNERPHSSIGGIPPRKLLEAI